MQQKNVQQPAGQQPAAQQAPAAPLPPPAVAPAAPVPVIQLINRHPPVNGVQGAIINPLYDENGLQIVAQGQMPHKQTILPTKFKGETYKLAEFLTDYAMYADAYRWDEATRCSRLPLHLEEVDRRVVLEVPMAQKTWIGIGQALNEKLLEDTSAKLQLQMFRDRVQKLNESVQQFAYDLKVLVLRANPDGFTEEQRQEFLLEQFLHGVKKEYRTHLALAGVDTFVDALKKAHIM